MAYLKQWAPRAHQRARRCALPDAARRARYRAPGRRGRAARRRSGRFDFAYLDPPYNQHRYEANYHVWETIVAWDAPEHYGVACKRDELRDRDRTSVFNRRRAMPDALRACIEGVDARTMVAVVQRRVVAHARRARSTCAGRGARSRSLAFDSKRYVGAQIGIHNPRAAAWARSRTCATSSTSW